MTGSPPGPRGLALLTAVAEIERHVAAGGWDQPPRLFALAPTAELAAREPDLAARLGLVEGGTLEGGLTPVEQEDLPDGTPLDEVLARIAWPETVVGCALVVERVVLPPGAEPATVEPGGDLAGWAGAHPDRQDVRIAVAVLRDGSREAAVRLRAHDVDTDVLTGPDLVPGLADALAATLE